MQRSRSSSSITFSYYSKVVKSFVFVFRIELCSSNFDSIFCCCVFGCKPTNVGIRFLFELSGSSIRVDAEKGD